MGERIAEAATRRETVVVRAGGAEPFRAPWLVRGARAEMDARDVILTGMYGAHDAELRLALAEGILSHEEALSLGEEARRLSRSPLSLLVERGRLSHETFTSLQTTAVVEEQRGADPDQTAVALPLSPARASQDHGPPAFPVAAWDRYQHVKFLGQGGMGRVFHARDLRLRRDVALKFIRGDRDPELTRRFIAEARAQARVNHEHVCKVHEVGEIQGEVYIAMQYIEGDPLGVIAAKLTVRQRRFVAVIAAALTLVLFALGWAGVTRLEATQRERLARRFAERVEHIEAIARYAALAPLHDTRPDQSALRAQMAELDAEIQKAGAASVGPGQYALGRGFLALGDEAKARESLESGAARGQEASDRALVPRSGARVSQARGGRRGALRRVRGGAHQLL